MIPYEFNCTSSKLIITFLLLFDPTKAFIALFHAFEIYVGSNVFVKSYRLKFGC